MCVVTDSTVSKDHLWGVCFKFFLPIGLFSASGLLILHTIRSVRDYMCVLCRCCLRCIFIWFHSHCLARLPRYVCGFSAWVCICVNVIMCTRVCLLLLISVDMRVCVFRSEPRGEPWQGVPQGPTPSTQRFLLSSYLRPFPPSPPPCPSFCPL